ncbi:MAG TPA: MBL fold metallo-hydrolase [Acetobacteraceae bacterium]|nr:MBL fold metallo-hydrolase [Acetobacteraceae bacterium]
MLAEISAFFDEATSTVSYLVVDPGTGEAAVIDPVLDYDPKAGRTATVSADRIVAAVQARGARVIWLLETHVHADHLTAGPYLQDRLGGRTAIGEHVREVQAFWGPVFDAEPGFAVDGRQFDRLFCEGDRFRIGGLEVEVWHTPGHTAADVTYRIGDVAFVGDTLFMPDYGTARADFPGGDARALYRSIRRILSLPPETRLFTAHDYKAPARAEYAWESTVAAQRAGNVHVRDSISEDDFVAQRVAKDATLSMPALILPSVQVNMRAGRFPPPAPNGRIYLQTPLNVL